MADNYGGGAPARQILSENPRYRTRNITAQKKRRRVLTDRPVKRRNRPRIGDSPRPRQRSVDPLLEEIRALTQLQFGPQEQAIDYRRKQEQQFGVNTNAWYAQHVKDVQVSQAQQNAFNAGLVQGAYNQANQAATADAGVPGLQGNPQAQQAAQARQTLNTAGANMLAGQASAQGAYMANNVQAASEQGIQAQQDAQERQRALSTVAQDLAREKGAAKVKTKMDLQEAYWKRRLEEAVFGLDQMEAMADIRDDRADNRRQSRNDRFSRRDRVLDNRRADRAEDRQQRNTDSLIQDRREDNARQRRRDLADDGRVNGSNFTPTQIRSGRRTLRNLVNRVKTNQDPPPGVDSLLARAAVQLADDGGVDPGLARKIKRAYGFTPKIRRNASAVPRNADGTPG